MRIGERIKQRREELGLSVDDLAKRLGKHRATVYRYENGDIENMPADVLIPIAQALGTTPAELMGWEDDEEKQPLDMEGLSDAQKDLIALVSRLPEDVCAAMLIALRQQFHPGGQDSDE